MVAVSIVVRTFNRPEFLAATIADVRAQTFTDWELLIVNDGGEPGAVDVAVADTGAAADPRIRVVHLPENGGRWRSANAGARAAGGRYLNLHDDDDRWDTQFLAKTVAWLEAHPESDAVTARVEILEEDLDGRVLQRRTMWPDAAEITLYDLLLTNRTVPIGTLYRTSTLIELGYFDESLEVVGDWEYHLRLASRRPIPVLPGPALATWHQRIGADGDQGNSVIVLHEKHRQFDKLVRDRALRESVAGGDAGTVLYLTRFLDERFWQLNEHVAGLANDLPTVAELRAEVDRLRQERDALRNSWSFRIGRVFVVPVATLGNLARRLSGRPPRK